MSPFSVIRSGKRSELLKEAQTTCQKEFRSGKSLGAFFVALYAVPFVCLIRFTDFSLLMQNAYPSFNDDSRD